MIPNMGRIATSCKAAVTGLIILANTPASAQVPTLAPLNHDLRYDIYWNSLPLGRVRIKVTETKTSYSIDFDAKTRGIARMFDDTKSETKITGHIADGRYIPISYDTHTKDGQKHTTIAYAEDGTIVARDRKPMDNPKWRPIVPLEEANTAADPGTAFLRLRREMHRNMTLNIRSNSQRAYDGARLTGYNVDVVSRASLDIMGKHTNAINTVVKRVLVNGYTAKEIKKQKKEGDPTTHLYFSADERMIPLQVDIDTGFGTLSVKLTETK
jgi:hypothetical protein